MLTRRIRNNRVEQLTASPWILCNVEGTKVHNAVREAVLCSCADDSWGFGYTDMNEVT